MSEWDRLPGEPDEYWQCVACELVCLPGTVPARDGEVTTCPECGDRMIYVSDEVPEAWEAFAASVEAVRHEMDSHLN